MPPLLDVSDVLTDPDFFDQLVCTRKAETVTGQGLSQITPTVVNFYGVVTSDRGELLERLAAGERAVGSILVVTKTPLVDAGSGQTADVVTWNGRDYTVQKINPYSRYGVGFIEAYCDLLPLAG
jgi:galactose-6-phosphate isomerase